MTNFGKRNPLTESYFEGFIKAYLAEDRSKIKDERFNVFTREEIKDKNNSLDLCLIRDDALTNYENFSDTIESDEEVASKLEKLMIFL